MSSASALPLSPQAKAPATVLRATFSFPVMIAAWLAFLSFWSAIGRFDDPDLWWHLRLGKTIWDTGSIPSTDTFSFTAAGHPWVAHEWLSQVILYLTYQAGGYPALMLWLCLMGAAITILTFVLGAVISGNWKVPIVSSILALAILTTSLTIRPLLLGHLFLVTEMLVLALTVLRQSRAVWALPALFVVWVNCHGSFLFGILLLAAVAVSQCIRTQGFKPDLQGLKRAWIWGHPQRRLFVVLGLCVVALFVNPIGPGLVLSPLNVLLKQPENLNNVQEWQPLNIQDPHGMMVMLTAVALILFSKLRPGRIAWKAWLLFASVTVMALEHVRMAPIFGFVAAPIAACYLAEFWDNYDPRRDFPWLNALLIAAAIAGCAWLLPSNASIESKVRSGKPVAALAAMKQQGLDGPLLNYYAWGGYLMWARPDKPVFIDGRTDIYVWTGVFTEYGRWATLQDDPRVLLDRYHIEDCLLPPDAPMAHVLAVMPGWRRAYADDVAVVFTRQPASGQPKAIAE